MFDKQAPHYAILLISRSGLYLEDHMYDVIGLPTVMRYKLLGCSCHLLSPSHTGLTTEVLGRDRFALADV